MIDSLIGWPESKLRGFFRVLAVAGATTLAVLIGTMALSSAPALAAGPPEVHGESLAWAASLEARVEATVNPTEQTTECHLQYGTTSVTEHEVPCEQASIEGGEQGVATTLTGLTAASTYHYQFVLKNGASEEATGAEETFETAPLTAPAVNSEALAWAATLEAHVEAIVNPDNQNTKCHIQYGTTTVTEHEVPCEQATLEVPSGEQSVGGTLSGLTAATKYHYRFALKNTSSEEETGATEEFETAPAEAPKVESQEVTATGPSTATLTATVDSDNQISECHVQYGKTTVTENEAPCEPEKLELPSSAGQGVAVNLVGLDSATEYHYRFVLKNGSSVEGKGAEEEFETVRPPSEVETGEAERVTATSAELEGELNAGGEATYYIEYGTAPCGSTTCGQRTEERGASGRTQEPIAPFGVTGLEPNTTYHYWLVADNGAAAEPVHGEEGEFTTLDFAPAQIEIGEVEDVTTTSAILTGKLNPGSETTYYVEYGAAQCSSSTCGQRTPEEILTGETQTAIAPIVLSGLQPNTVYHYWLVAENTGTTKPVHGVAAAFKTAETPAEEAAEKGAGGQAAAEAAAQAAAQSKLAAEAQAREAAANAVAAAQSKQYNEILAVTAANERHEAEEKRVEEVIAATSAKITKTKVGTRSVVVTVDVTQAGTVTISGTGLKSKTEKIAVGTHSITVALTSAGKKDRKHHKKVTITAALETSLTSVSASTTVKL
jgi:hypothetical protein